MRTFSGHYGADGEHKNKEKCDEVFSTGWHICFLLCVEGNTLGLINTIADWTLGWSYALQGKVSPYQLANICDENTAAIIKARGADKPMDGEAPGNYARRLAAAKQEAQKICDSVNSYARSVGGHPDSPAQLGGLGKAADVARDISNFAAETVKNAASIFALIPDLLQQARDAGKKATDAIGTLTTVAIGVAVFAGLIWVGGKIAPSVVSIVRGVKKARK